MQKYFRLLAIVISLSGFTCNAQDLWTLEDCLVYAWENNIALQRYSVNSENLDADLRARKFEMFPELSFSSQGSMNFGRSVDPETNTITFNKNITNYYYLGTDITLFNGFASLNRLSAANFMHLRGKEQEENQKNLLSLDIVNAYYSVLMARGVERSSAEKLEVTKQQMHKTQVLVETGAESRTTLMELQSQVANDKLLLIQAQNNSRIALENLRLLLQIEPGRGFDVDDAVLLTVRQDLRIDMDSVYNESKEVLPRIKALEYQSKARMKELAAARGASSPSIGMFAGWRTGYYDALTPGEDPVSFSDQLRNNTNQYVGFNLNIPILNSWYHRTNIKKAKLNLKDSELELKQEYNILYNEVSKACIELVSVKEEYISALENLNYNEISFEAVSKKFDTGLANVTEFAEAKRALFAAEMNLLRARLQYSLKMMTIDFYLTGKWINLQ